jgi:Ca2+-binding EF-hand superfamily protein
MKAFKKLDATKNGLVTLEDIKLFYNAKLNPKVLSGEKTEDQVLLEFLDNFDTIEKDGTVTYEVRFWSSFIDFSLCYCC